MSLTLARSRQMASTSGGGDDGRSRLMCSARNCPNLWSTSDGHLCRWHADADPIHWPRITQEMQDYITDRAQVAAMDRPPKPVPVMSSAEKRAIAERLRVALEHARANPRAWIDRLKANSPLTAGQKHALNCVRNPIKGEPA